MKRVYIDSDPIKFTSESVMCFWQIGKIYLECLLMKYMNILSTLAFIEGTHTQFVLFMFFTSLKCILIFAL